MRLYDHGMPREPTSGIVIDTNHSIEPIVTFEFFNQIVELLPTNDLDVSIEICSTKLTKYPPPKVVTEERVVPQFVHHFRIITRAYRQIIRIPVHNAIPRQLLLPGVQIAKIRVRLAVKTKVDAVQNF